MNNVITFITLALNILLLIFCYVAFDEINFHSRWNYHWEENIFLILLIAAPLSSLGLLYIALREDWLDYLKLTLQRRRLEGERRVIEEHKKIEQLQEK